MSLSESKNARLWIVYGIALPLTIVWGTLAVWGALFFTGIGVDRAVNALAGEAGGDELRRDAGALLVMLLWSVGGIAGLLGFWLWAGFARPLTRGRCLGLAGVFAVGIAASAPYFVHGGFQEWWDWLLAAAAVVAGVLSVDLVLLGIRAGR